MAYLTSTPSFAAHPFAALLERHEWENVSPATSLDFAPFLDAEGWPLWETYSVGDLVETPNGLGWKIVGFSLANHVFAIPYGLGHDGLVRGVEWSGVDHLKHIPAPITATATVILS